MGRGSHFPGGVVRLGHPVPTLDLIVESRIHHHARVGCAPWKPRKKATRLNKCLVHFWNTWGDTAHLENTRGSPPWSTGSFRERKKCYLPTQTLILSRTSRLVKSKPPGQKFYISKKGSKVFFNVSDNWIYIHTKQNGKPKEILSHWGHKKSFSPEIKAKVRVGAGNTEIILFF